MALKRTSAHTGEAGEGSKAGMEDTGVQVLDGGTNAITGWPRGAVQSATEATVTARQGECLDEARLGATTPRNAGCLGGGMGQATQAIRSPPLSTQRPDFRTMSMDSQQFLQHALSVDGEALQQYLENETGTHFTRLSVSPTKQAALGWGAGGAGGAARKAHGYGSGVDMRVKQDRDANFGRENDDTQLADMMHSLVDDPHFDVGMLQAANLQPLGGELLSADTLDRVLGGEMREIAAEVKVKQEAGDMGLTSRVMEGIQGNSTRDQSETRHGEMPPPSARDTRVIDGMQKLQMQSASSPPVIGARHQPKNQYVTFMDGDVLQRDDGTPAIVTFPENSMAASIQVPIPGSERHLHFVPLLNSKVSVGTVGTAQVDNAAVGSGIFSPSQTERMVADAAKQHAELVIGVETQRKSAEIEFANGMERKPQLRLVESSDPDDCYLHNGHDGGSGQQKDDMIERKVSHKRERSVTLRELPNLELDKLPSAKLLGSVSSIVGAGISHHDAKQFPNGNPAVAQGSEFFASTDGRDRGQSTPPTPSTAVTDASEDAKKQLTAFVKPLKLFCDGLDDLIDDEIRKVISNTLETPPGTKRRGRPPGRSKNIADILPEGWVEPTDAEILANLLLEKPHMKKMTVDELKKHIRKEKNKISAAMSRVRLQNETRDLEGQIRKLEEEHSTLSEWLSTGSGGAVGRKTEAGPGEGTAGETRVTKNTLIRHFSL